MGKNQRLSFQKGDFLAIILVAALALAVALLFLPGTGGKQGTMVQIYRNGVLTEELTLSQDRTLELSGDYHCTVTVKDGKVAITDSDCPGEDCVHTGWIESPGRSIVCIPNRVEVRVTGSGDVDFVVG